VQFDYDKFRLLEIFHLCLLFTRSNGTIEVPVCQYLAPSEMYFCVGFSTKFCSVRELILNAYEIIIISRLLLMPCLIYVLTIFAYGGQLAPLLLVSNRRKELLNVVPISAATRSSTVAA
jgi:hypothetical protein